MELRKKYGIKNARLFQEEDTISTPIEANAEPESESISLESLLGSDKISCFEVLSMSLYNMVFPSNKILISGFSKELISDLLYEKTRDGSKEVSIIKRTKGDLSVLELTDFFADNSFSMCFQPVKEETAEQVFSIVVNSVRDFKKDYSWKKLAVMNGLDCIGCIIECVDVGDGLVGLNVYEFDKRLENVKMTRVCKIIYDDTSKYYNREKTEYILPI